MTTSPETDIHEKLEHLLVPSTRSNRRQYSVFYGGRGGLKTYGCADAMLIRGARQYERVLCARETMDSIAESVHFTLEKRIYDLGLEKYYKIMQYKIEGPEFPGYGHTEFFFAGLRHNVRNIKSLEAVTICWVEEAANVSKDSWDILLPTVRWQDKLTDREAEVWVTFNPELPTDDTYVRWVLNPPPYTKVVETNWRDNKWLPEVLRIQLEHSRRTDPDGYQHIWEGGCITALKGAIYREEYKKALAEGRIGNIPVDRGRAVDTFWDIGYNDKTAIWFVQQVGPWWHFVDYLEHSAESLHWYVLEMQRRAQERGYVYGTDWLPHDGVDAMLHGKVTNDRTKSPDQILRSLGRRVRIAPKLEITTGINAVRTQFPQCRFDEKRCEVGLRHLQMYQWGEPAKSGQERTKPLHDEHSHGADALRTWAVSAKPEEIEEPMAHVKPRGQWGGAAMPF